MTEVLSSLKKTIRRASAPGTVTLTYTAASPDRDFNYAADQTPQPVSSRWHLSREKAAGIGMVRTGTGDMVITSGELALGRPDLHV